MIEKVINFGMILDGFWFDFGRIWGDFWHLFWNSISDGFPSAIRKGFWTDSGSKNVPNRVFQFSRERLVGHLGASRASKWPPKAPTTLQKNPKGCQVGLKIAFKGPKNPARRSKRQARRPHGSNFQ